MTRKGKHQQLTVLPCWITCSALKALLLALLIHAGLHVHAHEQSNFQCTEEGYHADPVNCHIYYRCVSWGDDRPLSKFNFECGPGTVFSHAKGDICIHPRDSERPECNESGNDIDSSANQPDYDNNHYPSNSWPMPSPAEPPSTHSPAENEVYEPSSSPASSSSSHSPKPTNHVPPSSSNHGQCQEEGYLTDSHDCSKFIRCVDAGQGSLTRYEFTCGTGTVWDPENEVCNHAWAVKRLDCAVNPGSEASVGRPDSEHSHAGGNNHATSPPQPCHTERPPVTSYPGYPSPSDGSADPSVASPAPPSPSYLPSSQATPKPTSAQSPSTVEPAPSSPSDSHKGDGSSPRPGSESSGAFTCTEEGFFADPNSCNKFYRCAQGDKGLQKYEFQCGEGTAWDSSVQTCNYNYAVPGCGKGESAPSTTSQSNEDKTTNSPSTTSSDGQTTHSAPSSSSTEAISTDSSSSASTDPTTVPASPSEATPEPEKPSEATSEPSLTTKEPSTPNTEEVPETSATSPAMATASMTTAASSTVLTTKKTPSPTAAAPASSSVCQEEGFFPDPEDCRKFIRCVGSNDGYSVYKFDCAPGTAWDQTLLTCNHIAQVPSCGSETNEIPSGPDDGAQETAKPTAYSTPSTTTMKREESSSQSTPGMVTDAAESTTKNTTTSVGESSTKPTGDCATKKPMSEIVCNEAGFFANPSQCDKFYRCVDNGNGFNVYHFDCPPGTIFDPSISVCNYPESVYPARDCASGGSSSSEPTTAAEGMTEAGSETSMTTQQAGETSGMTEATSEGGTEATEAPGTMTTGAGDTQATEESSTDQSTAEAATTEATGASEATESQSATTEAGVTTENGEATTAAASPATEAGNTEAPMVTPCPIGNLTDEQIVLVCPTGFKRHPKYCNMFYQCSNEEEMKVKILVLACPEGTIFDEEKIKCSPESESSQACTTEMASARFYRHLETTSVSPIRVSREALCPGDGHYPYQNGCNNAFYKCQRDSRSQLQGYLYKCPQDFVYWSVSRRCERASRLSACSEDNYEENARLKRWDLPVESNNLSARSLRLRGKV